MWKRNFVLGVIFTIVLAVIFSVLPKKEKGVSATSSAQSAIPNEPEKVRIEDVHFTFKTRAVTLGNQRGHYQLVCNIEASSCIAPTKDKDYYVIDGNTNFTRPGASGPINLKWLQAWTVTYTDSDNIGLVPVDGGDPAGVGMYRLISWEKSK
jgi:hypothetical protein